MKSLQWIYQYSKSSLWMVALVTMISALISGSFIALALVSSRLLDIATGSVEGNVIHHVFYLILIVVAQAILNILYSQLYMHASTRIEMNLKQGVFQKLLGKQYLSLYKIHSGEILNRLTSDIDIVVGAVVGLIPSAVNMLTKIIAGLIVLFSIDSTFMFIVFCFGLFVCVVARIYSRHFKYLHKEVQRTNGVVRSCLQEWLENLIVIKSFVNEQGVLHHLHKVQSENYKIRIKRNTVSNIANTLVYVFFTAGYYFALAWGAFQISYGYMSFGTLTAFLQIIEQVRAPFRNISGIIPQFYSMQASAERLMELEQLEMEQVDQMHEVFDFDCLCVDQVSFAYDEEKEVLRDCSFTIYPNDLVAIIGESGGGKSTLMKLLLALMPVRQGSMYFKVGEQQVPIDAGLRSMFSYVPQGNMIMSGTIRDNLTFLNETMDDETILKACECACIKDYITSLPLQLDTKLQERGEGLSQGQIQRLAIARALLNDAPILLLDECTSALDEQTEAKLLQNLKQLQNKTVICITHTKAGREICTKVLKVAQHHITSLTN